MFGPIGDIDKGDRQNGWQAEKAKTTGAHEQFAALAGIFQRLAIDMHTRPDVLADIGAGPEPIDRQRQDVEKQIDERQLQQTRPRHIIETQRLAGWQFATGGGRRKCRS